MEIIGELNSLIFQLEKPKFSESFVHDFQSKFSKNKLLGKTREI
jgi:hypothetical protein